MKLWDLHMHTFFSDGENSPYEIIQLALKNKISGISITDHDNIDGFLLLKDNYNSSNLKKIIPGIEITTIYENKIYHLLAYNFDIKNKGIKNLIKKNKEFEMYNVSYSDYEKFCHENNFSLFHKKSIVRYLQKKNVFKGNGKEIKSYFFKSNENFYKYSNHTDIEKAIELVKEANGYSIIAHPFEYNNFPPLEKFIKYGIDGIEVNHYTANEVQRKFLFDFVLKNNLIPTGGSDFHSSQRHKIVSNTIEEKYICKLINNE